MRTMTDSNTITRDLFRRSALILLVAGGTAVAQPGRIPVDIAPRVESEKIHPGGTLRAAIEVRLPKGFHVQSDQPLEDYLIPTELRFVWPEGLRASELVFPEHLLLAIGGAAEPLAVFEEEFVIGLAVDIADDIALGKQSLRGKFFYQACDDKSCFSPTAKELQVDFEVVDPSQPLETSRSDVVANIAFGRPENAIDADAVSMDIADLEPPKIVTPLGGAADALSMLNDFEVVGTAGGFLDEEDFLAFISRAESGEVEQGWFEGRGPLAILALVLLGGLALNLTPCVLPMIPINLGIIGASAQDGSRARGFALGGVYGLAMAFVYGVLGLIVVLTAGTFGTINASPWFNLGIAVLFVVLALAMFDVLVIDFSSLQSKFNIGTGSRGSFLLAFGMGAIAALLAGACVAPVVIQVVVFSSDMYARGAKIALALPFLLGVGMALPWPFAGAGLSFLPKPGAWMVRVKQAMGVFILAFASYYGYLAYTLFSDRWVDPAAVAASAEAMIEEGWQPDLATGLAIAKAENKMVLVDSWATWCKNCQVMDQTTLKDEEVLERLEDYVKVKFQAEDLTVSPAKEIIERFQGIGLPTYAILRPAATRPES